MAKTTKIAWATSTWNPWYGCQKVSEGCAHCYAEREIERYGKSFKKVTRSKTTFGDPLKWKEPQRIFTCSWSDFFIPEADSWREEAWNIIQSTPHHTYMILTKRPENIRARLPWDWGALGYKNVWLGTSTENQKRANERIRVLLDVPARLHFLSAEPLLGALDLTNIPYDKGWTRDTLRGQSWKTGMEDHQSGTAKVGWVIAGSESGAEARPCDLKWVRSLRNQCISADVPFFWKQHIEDGRKIEMPELDGRVWDELPQK